MSIEAFRNADAERVLHTPGFSLNAARLLVEERGIVAMGIDTLNADPGSDPTTPVRLYALSHGLYFVESLANLEELPPKGAILVASPLKVAGASGSPSGVCAIVPLT